MKYKKIFIACPISKYLIADGICKDFEIFIKDIYEFCQGISSITFLALDREEYGKKKMYGSDCTTADFNEIQNTMHKSLSKFEEKVLDRYIQGESYENIAKKLETPVKSVDNAIQRIRKKAIKNMF